ncbi:hypothetical protein ISS42_02040 [Candidatus Shapirobacteria bacterium]|nr:hypothetical protein [Candidatus Shapirobacteria bacterium]
MKFKGVIDSHVHIGAGEPPIDGFIKRGLNIKSLTALSRKTGVAFVPKMHFGGLIEPVVKEGKILIFPSLTFNSETDGFSQSLVYEAAQKVRPARLCVFFPSLEAETHLTNIDKPWFSIFQPLKEAPIEQKEKFANYQKIYKQKKGIKVLDKNGSLLPEVKKVIKAVQETGSFLHTSHLGEQEIKKVLKEAVNRKTEAVVTHANARANNIKLETLAALVKLAPEKGARICIEFCAANWIVGLRGAYDLQKNFVVWIQTLKVENCILSSDANGLEPNRENEKTNAFTIPQKIPLKTPLDWLEYFVNLLMGKGITPAEVHQMIVENPNRLLNLKPEC